MKLGLHTEREGERGTEMILLSRIWIIENFVVTTKFWSFIDQNYVSKLVLLF